jgi:NAD(P)-dependent dehydrogenase (short-subunit alcohol dehydrogenase family)
MQGVRVNSKYPTSAATQSQYNTDRMTVLCPYFIDTPIIPAGGRLLLAGGAMGKPEDVVDAGTRLMADSRIAGRALAIGPRVTVDGDWQLVPQGSKDGKEIAVWEAYADDFVEVGMSSLVLTSFLA